MDSCMKGLRVSGTLSGNVVDTLRRDRISSGVTFFWKLVGSLSGEWCGHLALKDKTSSGV